MAKFMSEAESHPPVALAAAPQVQINDWVTANVFKPSIDIFYRADGSDLNLRLARNVKQVDRPGRTLVGL